MAFATLDFSDVDRTNLRDAVRKVSGSGRDPQTYVAQRKDDNQFVVLTPETARDTPAAEYRNVVMNQSGIDKGGIKGDLLQQDLQLTQLWAEQLSNPVNLQIQIHNPQVSTGTLHELANTAAYIVIRNFPMPPKSGTRSSKPYPQSVEPLIVITEKYPDLPPHGVWVQEDSPNFKRLKKTFKDHHFSHAIGDPSRLVLDQLTKFRFRWICYHFREYRWQFNPKNLADGDSLFSFLASFHAAAGGAWKN